MGIHDGHRKRMKEEFLKAGLEHMPPHRVLELLLFYSIPQGDVNGLAHDLLTRFGSLAAVLEAPYDELLKVSGVGPHTASHLALITALARRYYTEKAEKTPYLSVQKTVNTFALGNLAKMGLSSSAKKAIIILSTKARG